MKVKFPTLLIALIFSIFTCKKDSPQDILPPIPPSAPNYFPFTIGNYWIYDHYKVNDTTGVEEQLNAADTIRIIGEKIINDKTYYVFEQREYWLNNNAEMDTVYYRDSSGYIVDLEGTITFSSVDFNNIIRVDSLGFEMYFSEYSVSDTTENITVPAGTFECLNFKGKFNNTNPDNDKPDRFLNNC